MSKTRKTKTKVSRKAPSRNSVPEDGAQAQRVLEVPLAASELQPPLDTLRDRSQHVEARLEALQSIQAASFAIPDFDSIRPDYIAALRQAAEDQDPELRQRALGILARDHDGFAQEALLEGLRDPARALVEPDKALQLLSYDTHAGVYPLAREIMQTSDDESTRREALRVLASDPTSAPLLENVLADKSESSDIRRMSASALHALNPDRLQRWANKAVLDIAEDAEMVATGLTALTQFGDAEAISGNKQLRKRVDQLQERAPAKIKKLARRFVQKYDL
jgi:mannose-6-phosphate isomerase class I